MVNHMNATDSGRARVTSFEPAATGRWLARALSPARARIQDVPTAEAVERMRDRVFGETAAEHEKPPRTLAA